MKPTSHVVLVVVDAVSVIVLIFLDGDPGSPLFSEGVYIGEGLGELDEELDFWERAEMCLLFGGGGSSVPISSSACSRS